ncbi:hypothetical protein MJG53_020066 [Ovis ammon polii x Ovis aries]|uniref:G-protein coupled receptors family 3 profile domain-containing protein n=2 Tax=Ovis TaxID=9935 RepID=A0A835ZJ33_SHEEP|nr:hypothetical protein JEQ12_020414 [Ovis aries]KAI4554767.1 hypothetical protein MJG53_020066 [Ovis ammon polii x Ovis aries]
MDTHSEHKELLIVCNKGSITAFYCVLGFLGSITPGTFSLAFLAMNLPDTFSEAKFLTFSMLVFCSVWVTFLLTYHSTKGKVNDTIQTDLETGKITDFIKFGTGNLCIVTGGAHLGRIGVITNQERHPDSFDLVHVKDVNGNSFATRLSSIFVIGKGNKPWISLPHGKGIRLTIAEERDKRLAAKQSSG